MSDVRPFSQSELEQICGVLGDTGGGLTGSEIQRLLASLRFADPTPALTKSRRLFNALAERQSRLRSGTPVAAFIQAAMDPVRYTEHPGAFSWRRDRLNVILAFCSYSLGEDGKLRPRDGAAKTLSQAEEAAGRLRAELSRRAVHPDVLKFCRAELVEENYFHAVFEATKSIADKIRDRTSIDADGATLVDRAFLPDTSGLPVLAFNTLQTETERSGHRGLMQLLKGVFGTFRNVHEI